MQHHPRIYAAPTARRYDAGYSSGGYAVRPWYNDMPPAGGGHAVAGGGGRQHYARTRSGSAAQLEATTIIFNSGEYEHRVHGAPAPADPYYHRSRVGNVVQHHHAAGASAAAAYPAIPHNNNNLHHYHHHHQYPRRSEAQRSADAWISHAHQVLGAGPPPICSNGSSSGFGGSGFGGGGTVSPVSLAAWARGDLAGCGVPPAVADALDTVSFDPFTLRGDGQIFAMLELYRRAGLIAEFSIPTDPLVAFICELRATYHNVPYHCFSHAMDVAQTAHAFLAISPSARALVTDAEYLALVTAALAHDMGHPGTNNGFQVATKSDLARIYNNTAVLENFHAARANALLRRDRGRTAWFDAATGDAADTIASNVTELILATDMARHFDIIKQVKARLGGGDGGGDAGELDPGSASDRLLVQKLLIKSADIGNIMKPFAVSARWADRLLEEFFAQGDAERAAGVPVTPFMDRALVSKGKSQVGFIGFMGLPLFETLASALPELESVAKGLAENLATWKEMAAEEEAAAAAAKKQESQ
jgi:hypothetical protein